MLIKKYELKEETVLEIGKFAILWNLFEHDWCSNNCNPRRIREVANRISIDSEKQACLANVLNKRRSWFQQLEADYVRDSLHPGNARKSSEEDMEIMSQFMQQTGVDLTCGCLLVLHRIRNNLMHGIKIVSELDGQIELFQAANAVLENLR